MLQSLLNCLHKKGKSVTRVATSVAIALSIAACSSTTSPTADISAPINQSADVYLMQAQGATGTEKINWQILAARAYIAQGDLAQAEQALKQIQLQPLTPAQSIEWQMASAQISLAKSDPQHALFLLNLKSDGSLQPNQYVRFYQLQATAFKLNNQPNRQIQALTDSDLYLPDTEKQQNWQNVWDLLSTRSLNELQTFPFSANDDVLRGWVQLAILEKTYNTRPARLKKAVDEWLQASPYHPANQHLPTQLASLMALDLARPTHIALLLPLSGKLEKQGTILRDGYLAAMIDDSQRDDEVELEIYDSAAMDIPTLYQKLQSDGTDIIIGPLLKSKVSQLLEINDNQLPILALNKPNQLPANTSNSCFYSLSPEQEAKQAANYIFTSGNQYPLIFAPSSGFGRRTATAFIAEWKQLTGHEPTIQYFASKSTLQTEVNKALGLTDSEARIEQMKKLMDIELKSETRNRRDTDSVYMIATTSELTLLKPFIDVAISPDATKPKLYSSSRGYSNNLSPEQIKELSGVSFTEIPLVVKSVTDMTPLRDASIALARLRAMGMDTYLLTNHLSQMKISPDLTLPGETGKLTLNDQCVVQRQMSWVQYTGETIAPMAQP
ncbi:penicillin-binding protein activator [Vibrio sp. SS-MA-C1-2]|uniref:penicillin-binding protein activator n=1 Tax=Vibrio sp. SS-MA-C1-2 TaxID=2908646 RepID=UPI001F3647E6|nr:penicillin-binding protein activator [Vibrio sp. SS-MA-C1-2]UJF19080.1 penicillin-binding protein activator [Vibrio sp. SS-MA-C1-2]